jgi:D-sedoheptulose 7-phosphate isomerase
MNPVSAHLSQTAGILQRLDVQQIQTTVDYLRRLRDRDGRLFIIGNGGGQGSHMAADFRKIARIQTYAWGENVHDLTAYTNDLGWASATTNWLEDSRCGRNDAVFVMSVGGASREVSQNLKEAIFWAKSGPVILGIVGQNGGYTATHADACIIIPSGATPHVEGIQSVLWHLLVTELAGLP